MIYIIGLGAGSPAHITRETIEIISDNSRKLFLRTEIHPTVSYLKDKNISYSSFDYLYEQSENFEDIYNSLTDILIENAKNNEITYAVPGNPLVAEKSVFLLLKKAEEANIDIKVFPALSSLEVIYSALKIDPLDGLIIMDAVNLKPSRLNRNVSLLLVQLYAKHIASEAKLELMEIYPDTYPVTLIKAAGITGEERIETIPLYQLDRVDWIDHLTSAFIKNNQFPLPDEEAEISGNTQIERLVNIVSFLRSPDGCPWDREQTQMSIRKHIIEEAYEVIEAIEKNDQEMIKEELGDLLLQVVLQAQIACEENLFDFEEISYEISEKLIRRHPHVFKKEEFEVKNGNDVKNLWEKLKNEEKSKKNDDSILSSIPRALPSILRAEKIQRKAASVGFDWDDVKGVFDKITEEQTELINAYNEKDKEKVSEELGDLFFSLINFARWMKIDPEDCMTKANEKFIFRFNKVENEIKSLGKNFKDFSLDELEEFWQKAKK